MFLDILLSCSIGNNIFCIFKKFVFKFNKNRTTLTNSCKRNGQRNNEFFKKNFALLILIVFSFTLGIEYFNLSELRN